MKAWVGLTVMMVAASGRAQTTPSVDDISAQVHAAAELFEARLPSLTCQESVVIQTMKKGAVKKELHLDGTIRVTRTGDEKKPFRETHDFVRKDGVEIAAGTKISYPYFVQGGFANGLSFAGSRPTGECYDRSVARAADKSLELTVVRRPGSDAVAACQQFSLPGLKRVLTLDDQGHVLLVTRTMPEDVAKEHKDTGFASMAYGPATLGGEQLRIPTRMQTHDARDDYRMDAHYSGCQRYGASITVLPDVQKVPEP